MSEITSDFAASIAKRDKRFKNFWNYKPIPKLMGPDGFFASPKPVKAIFGANRPLAYGTLVRMADGSTKAIERIKPGDRIVAWHPRWKHTAETSVVRIAWDGEDELHEVTASWCDDLCIFDTTMDHAFPVMRDRGDDVENKTLREIIEADGEFKFVNAADGHVKLYDIEDCGELGRGKCRCLETDYPSHNFLLWDGIVSCNSTKTWGTTFETIMIYTGLIPPSMQGVYAHEDELRRISQGIHKRPRHCRIIVQSMNHFADTIEPILTGSTGLLPEAWSDYDKSLHMFRGPDGSFLEIMPIDPREKIASKTANTLRGGDIDHTQIDEITAEPAYTESSVRAAAKRDGPRTVSLAYCPQEGFDCWTYRTFYEACYEVKAKKTARKPPERCHSEVYSIQVSMKDNPSITRESLESQIRRLRDWEVAFRVHGEYSQRAANPFFDMETLVEWELENRCSDGTPCRMIKKRVNHDRGVFQAQMLQADEGTFDEAKEPIWRVWEWPRDEEKYVVVMDAAEGNPDSDPNAIGVWRCTEPSMPKEVAQLRMRRIKPGLAALQAAFASNVYGGGGNRYALVVPERNTTAGGIVVDRIRHHKSMYKRVKTEKQQNEQTEVVGWSTNGHTKGPMLDDAYEMLGEMASMKIETKEGEFRNYCPVSSSITLQELQAYEERLRTRKDGVKVFEWGARAGAHDDTVMQMMIAFRIIKNEYQKIKPCKMSRYSGTTWEDSDESRSRETGRRAFGGMKQKKSLRELRGRKSHARR